jgi:PilZ domain
MCTHYRQRLSVTDSTRKATRFNVSIKVTVSYQLNCQRHPPQAGILVNISETGLCLKTEALLPKDAVVFVDLELPGTEEKTRAIGKVVWNKPNGESGIELGYIPAKQFKFLAPFIQSKSPVGSSANDSPKGESE